MVSTPVPTVDNSRGILLMLAAIFFFTSLDAAAKALGQAANPVVALWARYAGQAVLVLVLVAPRLATVARTNYPRLQLLRSAFLMGATSCFFFGIYHIGLAQATAIMDVNPLLITLGAALFLGEKVGPRRWSAILIGFVGVLIVLRPGMEGFVPAALFTVMGMLGFAGRDLATRAAPPVLSNMQLGIYGFAMLIPTGGAILAYTGGAAVPGTAAAGQLLAASAFGVAAYWGLTAAMRIGEVAVVTPFRYTRLIFALILGVLVFGERPDAATLIGAAIIIASGVYTLVRQRRARQG